MKKLDADKQVRALLLKEKTRDPFAICQRFGITVVYCSLVDMRGYCLYEKDQAVIFIADDLEEYVAEYVCAHELGHFLLHGGMNRVFIDSRTFMVASKYENEADRFACQLLYTVPPLFSDRDLTDWQLSECLNVPVVSLDSRLMEMGIYH